MHSCSESKPDSQASFQSKREKEKREARPLVPRRISGLSPAGEGQLLVALAFILLFWVYLFGLQETFFYFCYERKKSLSVAQALTLLVLKKKDVPLGHRDSGACSSSVCPRRAWL